MYSVYSGVALPPSVNLGGFGERRSQRVGVAGGIGRPKALQGWSVGQRGALRGEGALSDAMQGWRALRFGSVGGGRQGEGGLTRLGQGGVAVHLFGPSPLAMGPTQRLQGNMTGSPSGMASPDSSVISTSSRYQLSSVVSLLSSGLASSPNSKRRKVPRSSVVCTTRSVREPRSKRWPRLMRCTAPVSPWRMAWTVAVVPPPPAGGG